MKPNLSRRAPDPYRSVATLGKRDFIGWIDADGESHLKPATAEATGFKLDEAVVIRQGKKYPGRRNYDGQYWVAGTGEHVWVESATEFWAAMWLDHHYSIAGLATQPMVLLFADGTRHYPDMFMRLENGRQVVVNVRAQERIDDKTAEKFAKTDELCRKVGWTHQIIGDIPDQERMNLRWISGYRQPQFEPADDQADRVVECVSSGPRTFPELCRLLDLKHPERFAHVIWNLAWTRRIYFDETAPLTTDTLFRKAAPIV